jgi:hypothetical protein
VARVITDDALDSERGWERQFVFECLAERCCSPDGQATINNVQEKEM